MRVVRIATHPDFQRMGYGSRALRLLADYYGGRVPCLREEEEEGEGVTSVEHTEVRPTAEIGVLH